MYGYKRTNRHRTLYMAKRDFRQARLEFKENNGASSILLLQRDDKGFS